MSEVLWRPTPEQIAGTRLDAFRRTAPGSPATYADLWRWSIDDLAGFWDKVWRDCGVLASREPDAIVGELRMPGAKWFEGARLNFAENLLRRRGSAVALVGAGEGREDVMLTAEELRGAVANAQRALTELGVGVGDRVAGLLPNSVETIVLMLATTSVGGIWTSCSPDFGPSGVVDRFGQVRPKVLCVTDGYRYNASSHETESKVRRVLERIDSIEHVVLVDFVGRPVELGHPSVIAYEHLVAGSATDPSFQRLPPDHPLYVMYSSGTTGPPKSIVHGAAGTLVKHLAEHQLQSDIGPGDVVFWFTTCGWMMWNWLASALASEATVVCYDGSPAHPDVGALWRLAERHQITHFGTSPKFLAANAKAGAVPSELADLSKLRALMSTGSPLAPELFGWAYANVKRDMMLASVSGGTDIIGCFVGGAPILPVRRGELQARTLGMAVEAWDERGEPVIAESGELVCTKPFPSMPTGFWNDPDGAAYHKAYFAQHPGVWTHGDFIEIREHGGVVIHGRSDTTLNPGGVRIGTAEIYRAVEPVPEVLDSIVVGRPSGEDIEVVLCVTLAEGTELSESLLERLKRRIREETSPRHVPKHVFAVADIPYTLSGKKVEKAVAKVLAGESVDNRDALANPASLDEYASLFASAGGRSASES